MKRSPLSQSPIAKELFPSWFVWNEGFIDSIYSLEGKTSEFTPENRGPERKGKDYHLPIIICGPGELWKTLVGCTILIIPVFTCLPLILGNRAKHVIHFRLAPQGFVWSPKNILVYLSTAMYTCIYLDICMSIPSLYLLYSIYIFIKFISVLSIPQISIWCIICIVFIISIRSYRFYLSYLSNLSYLVFESISISMSIPTSFHIWVCNIHVCVCSIHIHILSPMWFLYQYTVPVHIYENVCNFHAVSNAKNLSLPQSFEKNRGLATSAAGVCLLGFQLHQMTFPLSNHLRPRCLTKDLQDFLRGGLFDAGWFRKAKKSKKQNPDGR